MIIDIVLVGCFGGLIFSIYMLIRNQQVFKEVMKVDKKIFKKDEEDNYTRKYDEIINLLNEVDSIATYSKVLLNFWKRPSSFYKDFLERLEKET